jgi:hypothetical protein
LLRVARQKSISRFRSGFLSASDDCRQVDLYRRSDAEQCFQGGVPHLAFDVAYHLLREPGTLSHLIHGKTALLPLTPQDARYL